MEKNEKLKLIGVCVLSVVGLGLFLWALVFSQDKMNAVAHKKEQDEMLVEKLQKDRDIHEEKIRNRERRQLVERLKREEEYRIVGKVDWYDVKNEFGEVVSVKFVVWGNTPETFMEVVYNNQKQVVSAKITASIYGKSVWTNILGSDLNAKFDLGDTKKFVGAHVLGTDSISVVSESRFMFNVRSAKRMDIGIPLSDNRGNRTVEVMTFNLTAFNKIIGPL